MNTKKVLQTILIVGGAIGLIFSTLITIEKINLVQNPNYIPPCSINPIISCGSVMQTPQASIFGFPNSLIGIAGFAMMLVVGTALLAGASFKRWFWICTEVGMVFALIFVYWLFFQSVYRIQALCPYCIVIWTVTIPMFWYTTIYNIETGALSIPKLQTRLVVFLKKYHSILLSIFYLVMFIAILNHFWFYWKTLL
jgi:uncharacterized membrane protein